MNPETNTQQPDALALFDVSEALLKQVEQYKGLTIAGPDDAEGEKTAREALRLVVRTRNAVDARRLTLNKPSQDAIKRNNEAAKKLIEALTPAEEHLAAEIRFVEAERDEAERQRLEAARQKILGRQEELAAIGLRFNGTLWQAVGGKLFMQADDVKLFTDEEFDGFVELAAAEATELRRAEQEAEKQRREEAERLRQEREALERERAELERLKAEIRQQQQAKAEPLSQLGRSVWNAHLPEGVIAVSDPQQRAAVEVSPSPFERIAEFVDEALDRAHLHNATIIGVESAKDDAERNEADRAAEREALFAAADELEGVDLASTYFEQPKAKNAAAEADDLRYRAVRILRAAASELS